MCHAPDSAPPAAPHPGPLALAHDVHLNGPDGAEFMAYEAYPGRPGERAAVVLPDVRGLNGFYKTFARRLAESGVAAIAVDYYGRDLPDGPRDGAMRDMLPLVTRLSAEQVAGDARAAADRLRAAGYGSVFSVGFCFGGSQAWNQPAFDAGLAGCAGFYGRPDDCRPHLPSKEGPAAGNPSRAAMLLLVAGDDVMTPMSDFRAFDAELSEAGVPHEMVVYEGAPHGFFDAGMDGFAGERADAWRRLLSFLGASFPGAAS